MNSLKMLLSICGLISAFFCSSIVGVSALTLGGSSSGLTKTITNENLIHQAQRRGGGMRRGGRGIRRGGAVRRPVGRPVRRPVGRPVVRPPVRRPIVRPGVGRYPVYRGRYWRPGVGWVAGAAGVVALGFVAASAAAAYNAPPAPGPGYCWFYTNSTRTSGYWGRCP